MYWIVLVIEKFGTPILLLIILWTLNTFWDSETLQCHKNTQDLFYVCWGICAIRLFVGGNVDDCFSCPFMLYKVNYILLIINIIKIIFISKVEKSCFVFFNMLLFKDHNPQHFSVTLNVIMLMMNFSRLRTIQKFSIYSTLFQLGKFSALSECLDTLSIEVLKVQIPGLIWYIF